MVAPLVTAAITLAEMAPMLSRWFGASKEDTQSTQVIASRVVDIAKKVTNSPSAPTAIEQLQKSPKLLIEFQKNIIKLDQELEKSYLKDRIQARKRDMALMASGKTNIRANIMVVAAAFGLIVCLLSLAFYKETLPGEAVGIISTIAGIFGACLKDTYAFEFGSTRETKTKDVAMILDTLER
jgi:hypothetical protein